MTLKVREGSYYRRRDGGVVGPAKAYDDRIYQFAICGHSYRSNGRWSANDCESEFDLIAEVEVRPKLPFELRAGGKYVLDNGETVELRDSSFTVAEVHRYLPLIVPHGMKYGYVSCFGEVLATGDSAAVLAHIVAEYQEPPPSPVDRLRLSLSLLGTARKDDEAFALIRGVIAELEAKP